MSSTPRGITLLVACIVMALLKGLAGAQINEANRPGSLLAFPLVENTNFKTIVEITNRSTQSVWLECRMTTHPPGQPQDFERKGFFVHLTAKEPFWWDTSRSYSRIDQDGERTGIEDFADRTGFMFCWAIEDNKSQLETSHNFLLGTALLFNTTSGRAWQYNAIAHQALNVSPDRALFLDGAEYTMASRQIMFQGLSGNWISGLQGTLAVASLEYDFITSEEPRFTISLECWNQNEAPGTRYLDFIQFGQYDLSGALQLDLDQVFTPMFQCATMSNHPLWAVFYQSVGALSCGGNVWRHPATGAPAMATLPPVPLTPSQ